ncbi:hypothetical protein PINS_up024043 [Pythium insidiosum]|nr:hypothetical protein PINS_up003464 [Pythium insidiosum]GLE11568.1 hypothetical protein PINS_up024043 [Pythium insidiosum]
MFLPFKNLTNRQSAAYGVLCLFFAGGIKWLDANMPVVDPFAAHHDALAWSDMDEKGAQKK